MIDVDARDYGGSGGRFIKKQELRTNGPRQVVVDDIEEAEGFGDKAGRPAKDLVLVFTDGTRLPLRNAANRMAMIELGGSRTSGWIGQTLELYFSPDVPNPRGGESGGIRIRRAGSMQAPLDYVSDLESSSKGDGVEPPVRTRRRATRPTAVSDQDEPPF